MFKPSLLVSVLSAVLSALSINAAGVKQGVFPAGGPPSPGIAPANVFNGLVFTSAYMGNVGGGNVSTIPESFQDEVEQMFASMNNTLVAAGSSLDNVLSIEIHLANAALKAELDPIFAKTFGDSPVARTMFVVDDLDLWPFTKGARIQATAVAAQDASLSASDESSSAAEKSAAIRGLGSMAGLVLLVLLGAECSL